jgi:hypothetical protein
MSTKTIDNFFTGKTLVIPSYQRDYAWREHNVNDLFADIEEALAAGGSHYLGTFILSHTDSPQTVNVVDGQQRLTTLTMLLHELIAVVQDPSIKQYFHSLFIQHPISGFKFRVMGENEEFFRQLLDGKAVQAQSDGQDRLQAVHRWIRTRVYTLEQSGEQKTITRWLQCISQMEVLEFIEPNEGKAIRMFQSVNDRGVPLARMDIVKSLLIYYSNRYLDAQLDNHIAEKFGQAFRSFSRIKRLGREPGYKIRQIDRDDFREDDMLRYHYLAFDASRWEVPSGVDFTATSRTVLVDFLRPALKTLCADSEKLRAFILAYTNDLADFFKGLEALVEQTRENREAYLLWVVQDLSATLYPLIIHLHLKGWTGSAGTCDPRTLAELLALVDLRVFKLRGTNPQAGIFNITQYIGTTPVNTDQEKSFVINKVASDLIAFCKKFMPDHLMMICLDEDMYRNPAMQRILLQIDEDSRIAVGENALGLEALVQLVRGGLTVEHVLPQNNTNFNATSYGFLDQADYALLNHRLGNLLLIEASINSACSNKTVAEKVIEQNLYISSTLRSVHRFVAECATRTPQFGKRTLLGRTKGIADAIVRKWPLNG